MQNTNIRILNNDSSFEIIYLYEIKLKARAQ